VTQKLLYYPWGQTWQSAGTVKDNRFASLGQRDAETGNDPTLFRLYNPRLYRWLSPDPAGISMVKLDDPQTWNLYAYVRGNPVSLTDPTGLGDPPPGARERGRAYANYLRECLIHSCGLYGTTIIQGNDVFDFYAGTPTPEQQYVQQVTNAFGASRGIQVGPDGSLWAYQPASQICTNQGGCYDPVEGRWVNVNDLTPEEQGMVTLAAAGLLAEGPVNLAAVGTGAVLAAPIVIGVGLSAWPYALGAAGIIEAAYPGCLGEFVSGLSPSFSGASTPCYSAGFLTGQAIDWLKKH
jgi:RHS repeat-associated protein